MNVSRRSFLGSVASVGVLGGCRSGVALSGLEEPNLRFGVVSDIHVTCDEGLLSYPEMGVETLLSTLCFFRDRHVDAVVICGDMAERGLGPELVAVGRAWEKVFPGNRAPDGRPVEKLFVTGNHDYEGHTYGFNARRIFPDPEELRRNILRENFSLWWERAFHEPYQPIWMKRVKGYAFVGANWTWTSGHASAGDPFNHGLRAFYAAHGEEIGRTKPFFHLQHPHPKDTCFGPWAGGYDDGTTTDILSTFPNAVALSGHSHYAITDERAIWQGAFTSVGCSCLRSITPTQEEFPENDGFVNVGDVLRNEKHGSVWSVYDDRVEIERYEFRGFGKLGENWTLPLPLSKARPYSFAEHAARLCAPEFARGYALVAEPGGEGFTRIVIPSVTGDSAGRCHYYEIELAAGGRRTTVKALARNWGLGPGDPHDGEPTVAKVSLEGLGEEAVVTVVPIGFFGRRGCPLKTVYSAAKWR